MRKLILLLLLMTLLGLASFGGEIDSSRLPLSSIPWSSI